MNPGAKEKYLRTNIFMRLTFSMLCLVDIERFIHQDVLYGLRWSLQALRKESPL